MYNNGQALMPARYYFISAFCSYPRSPSSFPTIEQQFRTVLKK